MLALTRTSASEAETRLIGQALGATLRGGDIVLLEGPLGAGKTTLTRAVVEGAGLPTAAVASPTFVVVHHYDRPDPAPERPSLVHVDAYRLSSPEDLESLGWDAVTAAARAGRAAVLIEWPSRLDDDLGGLARAAPDPPARLTLEHAGERERLIAMSLPESWGLRDGFETLASRGPTRCPITGAPVSPASPTYPFSSERARLADLYRWMSGGYTISRDATEADFEDEGVRDQ